jgi:hypothetical protein
VTVPLNFEFPTVWVELDLDDEQGAAIAAQTVLGRFDEPVPRELAVDLEARFGAAADRMRQAEVQMGFALVPDPPLVGLAGWLVVRWYPAPGDNPIADLVAETVPAGAIVVDRPLIREEDTPLGRATVAIHRYSTLPAEDARPLGKKKASAPIIEHIRWAWIVDDPEGPPLLITVMTTTDRMRFAPELREHVEAFARGIRVGS